MDNNMLKKYIINASYGDLKGIEIICRECDIYASKYRDVVIGIYDYEDIRQIILIKLFKLIKTKKITNITNINSYIHVMFKNLINELIRKNKVDSKNLSFDSNSYSKNYIENHYDFEEEYVRNQEMISIRKIINECVTDLKDFERDILQKHYVGKMSIADYSRKKNLNYYTCIKRIRRIERKILEYIDRCNKIENSKDNIAGCTKYL